MVGVAVAAGVEVANGVEVIIGVEVVNRGDPAVGVEVERPAAGVPIFPGVEVPRAEKVGCPVPNGGVVFGAGVLKTKAGVLVTDVLFVVKARAVCVDLRISAMICGWVEVAAGKAIPLAVAVA